MAAGTLTFRFHRAVQMHARSRVAQRAGHGIETDSPSGTNECLCLHRACERGDEEPRSLYRAPLNGDVENVTAREAALTEAVVAVIADDDEAQLRTRNPCRRARPDHNRKTPEYRGCVNTVAFLGSHFAARESDGETEVLLEDTCVPRCVLSCSRHDDDAAP